MEYANPVIKVAKNVPVNFRSSAYLAAQIIISYMVKNASANARIKISQIKLRGIAINARTTAMIAVVQRLVINAR